MVFADLFYTLSLDKHASAFQTDDGLEEFGLLTVSCDAALQFTAIDPSSRRWERKLTVRSSWQLLNTSHRLLRETRAIVVRVPLGTD